MGASIAESVQDKTVTIGEQANFSCSAVGSEVDIQWTVNGAEYESCLAVGDADICFKNSYMNDTVTTRSTVIITNSSNLGVGRHTVQCIVQQDLDPDFGTGPFQENSTASLYIGRSPFLPYTVNLEIFAVNIFSRMAKDAKIKNTK